MKREHIHSIIAVIVGLFLFVELFSDSNSTVESIVYGFLGVGILAIEIARITLKRKGKPLPSFSLKEHTAFLIGCATGIFISLLFDFHNHSSSLSNRWIIEKLFIVAGIITYTIIIVKTRNRKVHD